MRKAFVIIFVVTLLLGVSGSRSVPAAQEELSPIDVANACNIATAINAYNALYPNSVNVPNTVTLEDAKHYAHSHWPRRLSDKEERDAWELVVIKCGVADLIPEAQDVMHGVARGAYNIALAINVYNALHPCWPIGYYDIATLEEVKEYAHDLWPGDDAKEYALWPAGLSDEEERAAWELIVINDGAADLIPAAEQALRGETRDDSNDVKIANASTIAIGINAYNVLNPNDMLPDDMTLAEVKENLEEAWVWPSFLTDAEAGEAWELIEISDGEAKVKESNQALEK